MSRRELDAAQIYDPLLRASYEACRELNARHGKTYYLATLLLPPAKRPYVHALYGFARYADDIVDDINSNRSLQQRSDALASLSNRFFSDLARGRSDDNVCRAVIDTVHRWQIPHAHFEAFLNSMSMDLNVSEYQTYDDLYTYVYGSAAVIGLQMVPILEPSSPKALSSATDLGVAFQLANFVRDVGEDLQRGRVYLPMQEVESFGLTRADLERRVVDDRLRHLLDHQIARVRMLAARARQGIDLLHPTSRPCIEAARVLYCGIVDEVERIDYDVFAKRATVPMRRRLSVALPAWRRAMHERRRAA